MQDLFYLENLHEKIFVEKTREYFNEIISSYHNSNYRSAIVMLWSVIVFDLLYKMEQLDSIYGDKTAKSIVDSIRRKQQENPHSSEWELYLINEIFKTGKLIDKTSVENLRYLQKIRHLSAHPIIKDDLSIYQPDREITRAMIKMALENVFIKPVMYIDKIFDKILTEISENKEILTNYSEVNRFVKSKYLDKLEDNDKCSIFKSLWKIVFNIENIDCNENREINARFLISIIENNENLILDYMKKNKDYFCRVKHDNKDIFIILVQLINKNIKIYQTFSDDFKVLIKSIIQNDTGDIFIMGCFVFSNFEEYFKLLDNLILNLKLNFDNLYAWDFLFIKCSETGYREKFIRSISDYYALSNSYDKADRRFLIIKRFISEYKKADFEYLLEKSENNGQTYNRTRNIKVDYQFLQDKILGADKSFDFSRYPRFEQALE